MRQRLIKVKDEKKYARFLERLKKLHLNIPFLEPVTDMPCYAKILKDMLSNKRKLHEHAIVALIEECNTIIHHKLLLKPSNLKNLSIPYIIGDVVISKALCDLRASVSLIPYPICWRL